MQQNLFKFVREKKEEDDEEEEEIRSSWINKPLLLENELHLN